MLSMSVYFLFLFSTAENTLHYHAHALLLLPIIIFIHEELSLKHTFVALKVRAAVFIYLSLRLSHKQDDKGSLGKTTRDPHF